MRNAISIEHKASTRNCRMKVSRESDHHEDQSSQYSIDSERSVLRLYHETIVGRALEMIAINIESVRVQL